MQNLKMKKGLAATLATTMVIGSSFTAFAADVNSGGTDGTGTSNGHLEKKVVNVVLPTESEAQANPFNYLVDPEDLIATGKDKDGNQVTKNADRVYFKNKASDGQISYSSSSDLLKVTNKSSVGVKLTVKTEVESQSTDIALADAKADVASAENALLYLGLKVGTDEEVIKTTGVSKEVTLDGVADNFEVKANDTGGGYSYAVKASATEDSWENTTFGLTGSCSNKDITTGATAPKIKVTWSWIDPSANAAPSAGQNTYQATQGTQTVIDINLGTGSLAAQSIKSVSFQKPDGSTQVIPEANYTFANGRLTLPLASTDAVFGGTLTSRVFTITFDNDAVITVTVTR